MAQGPIEAARLISTVLSVTSAPRSARDVLIDIIVSQSWHQSIEAEDKADAWLKRFKSRLQHDIDTTRHEGGFLAYHFNPSSDDYLQGSCWCGPYDTPDVQEAKAQRALTNQLYNSCSNLTPDEFETLSGRLLHLLKVEKAFVSRRSADQGVDFFGRVPMGKMLKPDLLDMGAEKHMFVWIVGQSKHYPQTKVSTAEIRELVGSVELARAKVFAGAKDPLDELKVRLCDPIIYMFFTTGSFTRDSKELLSRSGVLSFEGMQISQFLADHGVGIVGGVFDHAAFVLWLNS